MQNYNYVKILSYDSIVLINVIDERPLKQAADKHHIVYTLSVMPFANFFI